jgi:hypothetical protein
MNKHSNNSVKNGFIYRGKHLGGEVMRKLFLIDKETGIIWQLKQSYKSLQPVLLGGYLIYSV